MRATLRSAASVAVCGAALAIALGSCRVASRSRALVVTSPNAAPLGPREVRIPFIPAYMPAPAPSETPVSTGSPVGVPPAPIGPRLVFPAAIDIPYVVAGEGASTATIEIVNDGDAAAEGLSWSLSGDPSISLHAAPSTIAPGEKVELSLTWSGSLVAAIAQASLTVVLSSGSRDLPVYAVAGDPGIGASTWDAVEGSGGTLAGIGVTVALPSAPYPDGVSKFTDPSVRIFLPSGYRDRGTHDVVVHFHGWNTTLAGTLATHLYQEHLYASGVNAILVVPQGPVDAASGDFGKLMARGALGRLIGDVLTVLYRDDKITSPVRGDVVITAHSGGYQAAVASIDATGAGPHITMVNLFDALYGYESVFEGLVASGVTLRSIFTETGGAFEPNLNTYYWLLQHGYKVALEPTPRARRDDAPVMHFAPTTHDGTTRYLGAYGELLRYRMKHSRSGPRIELREVTALDHAATVKWLAPLDEDVTGFTVETSVDGKAWTPAARVPPSASEASFPLASGARVRVKSTMSGVDDRDVLPSDTYRVDPDAKVLVVDGFDRVLDGAFGGLHHDFAARIGEAAGRVASISHRAVTDDSFDLSLWPTVIWLLGDESTADVSLSAAEQTALLDYVRGGGKLLMSGSEVAFDIGQTPAGIDFLAQCFGASFLADDAGSREVAGHGPLSRVPSFGIGGARAPYRVASPDALAPVDGGTTILEYGSGMPAGVGVARRSALVAYPLELTDPEVLPSLVKALLAFIEGT